jgi:hypothetical protein
MYLSFEDMYTMVQNKTFDSTSNSLTQFKQDLNDSVRVIHGVRRWPFLEVTKTRTTVASQRAYEIPNSIRKLISLYVTVGTTIYRPRPIFDQTYWENILAARTGEDDAAQFMFVRGGQVELDPIPATSGNVITFRGRKRVRDMTAANYTTGTITSIANGATTVTASGTNFTPAMAGRFIKFSGANGDGMWYEIASITDATHLELVKPYEGTSIVAASDTFVIGDMPALPENYQILPVYRTLALHFDRLQDITMATNYWRKYDGGYEAGLSPEIRGLLRQMINDFQETVEGNYIEPLTRFELRNPNFPPDTIPISSFT